ncbi:tRNA 5-methoxyuridine(34)/uridine 5-oxyacetic acid(34) synthase CmoB [Moraxella caviae]|uniref:tRNA U34 carboxymethyltransferase n=1 Tax=Moraxella caviae TaxID=34060 RepID=A0A1T0A6G5_9GAMM|nr:tRNA 5-methoxyuridine(34)/uridine 5-oxyacetic acid(34) synthase CmoB [Moraxella caviae]OOR91325.1 tRNA 5-methoxyuridine(34)/uridine 5-oxyacetic acid(34) synthase CmoB [Moraxella caviae]STZ13933.1 tRNA (mo5U34)-methyltransferase [Moraxella caviae]
MTNNTIFAAEQALYLHLLQTSKHHPKAGEWLANLPSWLAAIKDKSRYAHAPFYASAVARLPVITPQSVDLADEFCVRLAWEQGDYRKSESLLKNLMPWRKGPFFIGDGADKQIHIDTEWRSDFKWQRVLPHIDLTGKRVLDVGGGSGYHGFRMLGAGAKSVVVIDPSCLFYHQFMAVKHFAGVDLPVHYIPVPLESLPAKSELFDTVFSMGVLYHRASPFEHLEQLKGQLRAGGTLVLETLVVDGDERTVLVPQDRYAQMNNVYFLPSVAALSLWLTKAGFRDVRCVDVDTTSTDEQRATQWMDYHSLADFLDKDNPALTVEGLPAPKRAVMVAVR